MALPYPPKDHNIKLADAARLTKAFRDNPSRPSVKAVAVDRGIIDDILKQNDCQGLRCYFALDDDGTQTLVFVGIDSKGNDMYNGVLAENTWPCPPVCDDAVISNSPLNK